MMIQRWIAVVLLVGALTGSMLADAAAQPPRPEVAITTVQVSLQVLGYDPGPIDGLGGRRTVAALAAYAQDRGITLNQATINLAVALLRAEIQEKLLNAGDTKDPGMAIPQGNLQTLPVYRW
jgi:peptidoglycan hydrolase-like protein with peptidoglycan-binding domain